MAKKISAKKFVERRMTAEEFAKIVGVTKRTVREYCMRIKAGQEHVLQFLKQEHGLMSVERLPNNRWSLLVRVNE